MNELIQRAKLLGIRPIILNLHLYRLSCGDRIYRPRQEWPPGRWVRGSNVSLWCPTTWELFVTDRRRVVGHNMELPWEEITEAISQLTL